MLSDEYKADGSLSGAHGGRPASRSLPRTDEGHLTDVVRRTAATVALLS